jgi:hypothetical protein
LNFEALVAQRGQIHTAAIQRFDLDDARRAAVV